MRSVQEEPTVSDEKNFERFREQVLIMAGHYDQVFSLRGDKILAGAVGYDMLKAAVAEVRAGKK